jgi:hypothetical protein
MKAILALACMIILLISAFIPSILADSSPPQNPCAFYGSAHVDGNPAPDGTNITFVVNGAAVNWTQTKDGSYGPFVLTGNDGDHVGFYVQGIKASQTGTFVSFSAIKIDLTAFTGRYVTIDQAFVSKQRASVGSVQTVGFHAEWSQDNSDVINGLLYTNNWHYSTNATGWITFTVTSSTVSQTASAWAVNAVNCSGVTAYTQTADIQTIIWDKIMIVDGGLTKNSIAQGETVTVWFKAVYEYDNTTFNTGVLYVNGSALTWSMADNRWEYSFTAASLGTVSFRITGATDSLYGITAINDTTGAKTLTVVDQPGLTAPILYGIVAIIIIAAGSAAIFLIRRKGYRLKVEKESPKKANRNRRMRNPSFKALQIAP